MSNYHGNKLLDKKFDVIKINSTNKNDLLQLIGPPSSISDFDKNKWFYIERLKTNQSIIKLGNQIIKKNNVLIVEFNEMGIIKNKEILNLENMMVIMFCFLTPLKITGNSLLKEWLKLEIIFIH